jgi:hypothetical protein
MPMLDLGTTLKNVVSIFFTPRTTPWAVVRLFWIAKMKPNVDCVASRLPKDMVKFLISFLCCGWRQVGTPKEVPRGGRDSSSDSNF